VTRRALAALFVLASIATFAACGNGDDAPERGAPCTSGPRGPDRVLVLGDSNLFESSEQVEGALSNAGFAPTLSSYPALGLNDLDAYWLGKLPGLLAADPDVVVVALGTNDTSDQGDVDAFPAELDRMMEAIGDRPVVWVTHVDPRPFEVPGGAKAVNAAIRAAPARWPNLTVLDRTPVLTEHPELLREDALHFTPAGMQSFADAIRKAAADALGTRTIACGRAED
jgi:lysophospholipase L1-like esterase